MLRATDWTGFIAGNRKGFPDAPAVLFTKNLDFDIWALLRDTLQFLDQEFQIFKILSAFTICSP